MHSAKHFDPELGIDIHMYVFPPLPAPVPLPTPHIGIVLDPFDYIPFIGGTVHVNGVKRATAGTGGIDLHIPIGIYHPAFLPQAPMGPQVMGEEIFMGSMTVVADGDPLSRIGMPVLDCNVVGLINPFRLKKPKKPQVTMSLPTALNVAIPNTVFVGGPPMISIMGMMFKGVFAGLGKLKKLKAVQRLMEGAKNKWKNLFKNMNPGFFKCKVLRAEPVDIRSGAVEVTHEDFSIPGRLPLAWTRRYRSDELRAGACGFGWHTPADTRLDIEADGSVLFRGPGGALAVFERLPEPAQPEGVRDPIDGALLTRVPGARTSPGGGVGAELHLRTKDDLVYVFNAPAANVKPLHTPLGLRIERLQDLHGNHWRFERAGERLVRIVESGVDGLQGRFLEIDDRSGRLHHIALHDPAGGANYPLVRYRYSEAGDLVAVHDALEAARTFEYRKHLMLRHADRTGLNFYYDYDDLNREHPRVVHAWGDHGLYDYRFAYNELLRETEVTDSLGNVSLVKFDANDLPLCEIDPLGGCTFFEYDDWGRTTAVTDPNGLRTEFSYDERGNLTDLKRPDESSIATAYDAHDKATAVTDPGGGQWTQTWDDARGLLVAQTTPLGATSRYEYDAHGQLLRYINPRGAVAAIAYDRHGQLRKLTNALGHVSRFEHDALGRLLRRTDPSGRSTEYRYDAKGRLTHATMPGGATVRCEYDAEDQLTRYIDENGAATELRYFGIGQIAERRQPDGHQVRYLYDTEEQLTGVVNQRGETYALKRDALGRIVEEVDYWGQARRYDYDAGGRITRSIDPLGRAISYTTDPLGRITAKTLPDVNDATKQTTESFKYSKAGQLVELKNAVSHVTRKYDADGRLAEEVQNGFRIENRFDAVGNRIERNTSAGNTVQMAYDLLDQPSRVAINAEVPITIERNALGQATMETLSPRLRRTLQYNDDGLLSAQAVLKDGSPLFDTRFDYDSAGNLTKRTDSELGQDRYTYDPMGRILAHTDPQGHLRKYLHDPAGDRLKTRVQEVEIKQAVGGQQLPMAWTREGECDGLHYTFDRAGNLVSRRHAGEMHQPVLRLEWDANQRLARSQWERGERHGQSTTYGYDPLGRRVFKRNPGHTTHYFWDGDALLAEVQQANEAQAKPPADVKVVDFIAARRRLEALKALHPRAREYVYRPGTFEPLVLIDKQAGVQDAAAAPHTIRPEVSKGDRTAPTPQTTKTANLGVLGAGMGLGVPPAVASQEPQTTGLGQGGLAGLGVGASLGATRPAFSDDTIPIEPRPARGRTPNALSAGATAPQPAREAASVFYYHNDPNGCPTRLTTAGGHIVWSASYTAWGQVAKLHVNLVAQPIRLQGQQEDVETGLHHNLFRYYCPGIGQYTSADPISLVSGTNSYLYANANPFSFCDPLGLECWSTARKKFWKAEAQNNPGKYSSNNLARMQDGKAPMFTATVMDRNGNIMQRDFSMELHHTNIPQRIGGAGVHSPTNLSPLTPWQHEAVDPFRHTGLDLISVDTGVGAW